MNPLAPPPHAPVPSPQLAWHEFGAVSAAPLVLLHGGHGAWQHWARNVAALSQRHHVLVPDMPGYGASAAPPEPSMASLLDTLRRGLDERLGAQTPVRLAGFSFGGLVAAQLAAQRSNITHLALLGAAGHGTTRRPRGKLLHWTDALNSHDPTALRELMRHNLLMHMLAHPASVDAQALDIHTAACLQTRFHSKKISRSDALLPALALARTRNPALRVSALWGEHDVTCTPDAVSELMQAAGLAPGRRLIFANVGHWVQFEAADAVNQALLEQLV
jgi:pimeloyl-ACP methyl ester carboxylesterase